MAMASEGRLPDGISPRNRVAIAVTATITFVTTVFVGLRLASRILTLKIKSDDWASVAALVFAYGTLTTTVLTGTVGRSGWPIALYDRATLEKRSQILLANNVLYNTSISLSKISILLLYRRIFTVSRPLRVSTWVMGVLILGYWLSCVFGLIFAYNPVRAQWQPWVPHTSIDNQAFWMAMGIVNIAYDIALLCMPQPLVWHLQMSRRRKLLLSGVFAVGGFVCMTSIVRVYYLSWAQTDNITYTLYIAGIWTAVETNMSIICACLPTLPNLVKYFRRRSYHGIASDRRGESRIYLYRLDAGKSCSKPTTSQGPGTPHSHSYSYSPGNVSRVRVQTDVDVEWNTRES